MTDASSIPVLVDADTGYGNFNNVRRLVRKLEQRGVAAVCIEDKLFPKTNSFIDGERQQLASIESTVCGNLFVIQFTFETALAVFDPSPTFTKSFQAQRYKLRVSA